MPAGECSALGAWRVNPHSILAEISIAQAGLTHWKANQSPNRIMRHQTTTLTSKGSPQAKNSGFFDIFAR